MRSRARTEQLRGEYFDRLVARAAATDAVTKSVTLDLVVKHLLEHQLAYFARRGKRHEAAAGKWLRWVAFASGIASVGVAAGEHSESPSPWSKREPAVASSRTKAGGEQPRSPLGGPIPEVILQEIAEESSFSERRADEAERELMEWKKTKFMEQHIGDEFDGMIVSVTKFGMFVELNELFIEGLVALATLTDDRYLYHENTRQIIGQRTRKTYSIGNPVRIFVDRIDHMQKRLQFGVVEEVAPKAKKRKIKG